MNIKNECQLLRQRIAQRQLVSKARDDARSIQARAEEMAELRDRLRVCFEQRAVLLEYEIPHEAPRDATRIFEELRAASTNIAGAPNDNSHRIGKLKGMLTTYANHFDAAIEAAVLDLKKSVPASDETFLRQVEQVSSYAAKVSEIRDERAAILSGREPSESADALRHFLQHLGALRAASDRLNPNEFPPAVLGFFKSARRGGAKLTEFTIEVKTWLEHRDLLKNVRITL